MTKFHFAFLSLVLLLIASCGKLDQKGPCTIDVICDVPGYNRVDLYDYNNQPLDTALYLSDGQISFSRTDSANMPYIAMFRFMNGDPTQTLELPVAIEHGNVSATIGEQVYVTGTPLNSNLQSFLNSRGKLSEKIENEVFNDTTLSFEGKLNTMQSMYSKFYLDAIIKNADNPIGEFIFEQYGHVLSDADKEKVEQKLKKNL